MLGLVSRVLILFKLQFKLVLLNDYYLFIFIILVYFIIHKKITLENIFGLN